MAGICQGRVVIVTGAGRGVGRGHALEFARQGASVVVNDLGGDRTGGGGSLSTAMEVVEEIKAMGGQAIANGADVSNWDQAKEMVGCAVESFGRLDVLVNNAGILRDRMMINMTELEWDMVVKVLLKGTFAPSHHAANYWRTQAKVGTPVASPRIINTASGSGLFGNIGQSNYGAAKAGVASFTLITARELLRYGITVNAISPAARTRMTEDLGYGDDRVEGQFDSTNADNVAPTVVWLGSVESDGITGRVFELRGGLIGVAEGWTHGPRVEQSERWDPKILGPIIRKLVEDSNAPAGLTA
ncbi:MAG: SDR family NAD(P)-dependent oxidoreductase [Gammaproteobacteria bacterium]|nr:SDR family NAD(P)-dependent oxidoreductase [Gammaproteobacteria bacterium]